MSWSQFEPLWLRLALVAVAVCAALPPVRLRVLQTLSSWQERMPRRASTVAEFVIIVGLLALFYLYSTNSVILGDTYSILTRSKTVGDITGLSWLNVIMHEALTKLIGGDNLGIAAVHAYLITSIAAGLATLLAVRYFTRNVSQFLVGVALIATFGAFQLYFGYIERYPTAYTLMFLFLVSAQRDLDSERLSVITPMLLALSLSFHLMTGVLLPSYIVAIYLIKKSRWVLIWGALVCLIALVAAFSVAAEEGQMASAFLPLVPVAGRPYAFFIGIHFLDLLNVILLSYAIVPVLLVSTTLRHSPHRLFLLAAFVPAAVFVLLVDPKLGAVRDWDLLSLLAPIGMFAVLVLLRFWFSGNRKLGYSILIPALCFALLHTGGWVYANHDYKKAYEFVKPYIRTDLHYSPEAEGDFLNVRYARIVHMVYGDNQEAILAQWRRLKGKPDDLRNRCNLAVNLLDRDQVTTADSLIRDYWQELPLTSQVFDKLTELFRTANDLVPLDGIVSKGVSLEPRNASLLAELSQVKERRGQLDSAFVYGLRAARLQPQTDGNEIVRLIDLARRAGLSSEADSLEAAIKKKVKE